jgi:hypothetical protein
MTLALLTKGSANNLVDYVRGAVSGSAYLVLPEDELRPIRCTQMGYPESSSDSSFYDIAAPARCAGAALTLFRTSGSVKDVVGRSFALVRRRESEACDHRAAS